jgi:hypothetical protein
MYMAHHWLSSLSALLRQVGRPSCFACGRLFFQSAACDVHWCTSQAPYMSAQEISNIVYSYGRYAAQRAADNKRQRQLRPRKGRQQPSAAHTTAANQLGPQLLPSPALLETLITWTLYKR